MRSPLIQRQTVEYTGNEGFLLRTLPNHAYRENSHWHEDLEIFYVLQGKATLFADGEYLTAQAGELVVINCESVHRIYLEADVLSKRPERTEDSDCREGREDREGMEGPPFAALDLRISRKFLDEQFPTPRALYFTNENKTGSAAIHGILLQLADYRPSSSRPHELLYVHGLLLQLLFHLCERGVASRPDDFGHDSPIRLKNILQYVDEHYHEPLTQADIANRFYFTPQYFSRYFKRCTGVTFSEHLTGRRLHSARQELLHTDKLITEIAFNNGFSDERSFISAFKKLYRLTPHQYRKSLLENSK